MLYGIRDCNREPEHFWGKNQFNNVFPMSLACWMRAEGIPYIEVASADGQVVHKEEQIDRLFGLDAGISPYFAFESSYTGFADLCLEGIQRVDVVVGDASDPAQQSRALEIKLVVVPDSTTVRSDPKSWAPEIVFRPSTSTNAAAGLFLNLQRAGLVGRARDIMDPVCASVHDWGNPHEMNARAESILESFLDLIRLTEGEQVPLVMCTVWRTKGKSPVLCDDAFDIFCWTDAMFLRMIVDRALQDKSSVVSRTKRAALRAVKIVYELIVSYRFNLNVILSSMSFNAQDDKDFAISGSQTIRYMKHDRLFRPILKKDVLSKVILNGGIERLSPERRLDATLYFAYKYGTQD